MDDKRTYFISDLHLGAGYLANKRDNEARAVRFLDSIADDAESLYMLGDILDYWFEYKTVVPRGYVRFFGALARLADKGVKIYWFIGNHDIWLFDYLRNEIGITVIDGAMVKDIHGKKFFMSHGDGLGEMKRSFKILRSIFRNKICQKLYSSIHPRWTVRFAHRWSTHSRNFQAENVPTFTGEAGEPFVAFCREYLANVNPEIDYFVLGHRHSLVDFQLDERSHMVILGDWIHHFSYGVFDGKKFALKQFDS